MSKAFPTDKDTIIDDLEDQYDLSLSEEEYERLRKMTISELLLIAILLARSAKSKA